MRHIMLLIELNKQLFVLNELLFFFRVKSKHESSAHVSGIDFCALSYQL